MGKIDKTEENSYLLLIEPENEYREEAVCIVHLFFSLRG